MVAQSGPVTAKTNDLVTIYKGDKALLMHVVYSIYDGLSMILGTVVAPRQTLAVEWQRDEYVGQDGLKYEIRPPITQKARLLRRNTLDGIEMLQDRVPLGEIWTLYTDSAREMEWFHNGSRAKRMTVYARNPRDENGRGGMVPLELFGPLED